MNTNATVAIKNKNGTYKSIRVIHDGDLKHTGNYLIQKFKDHDAVLNLINSGSRNTIDKKSIDANLIRQIIKYKKEINIVTLSQYALIKYVYLFKDNTWFIYSDKFKDFLLLEKNVNTNEDDIIINM